MFPHEQEALKHRDLTPLDPKISDGDLRERIDVLWRKIVAHADAMPGSEPDFAQLDTLDDLAEELDEAMRVVEARKMPSAEPDA